jgi:hypothetical protein
MNITIRSENCLFFGLENFVRGNHGCQRNLLFCEKYNIIRIFEGFSLIGDESPA